MLQPNAPCDHCGGTTLRCSYCGHSADDHLCADGPCNRDDCDCRVCEPEDAGELIIGEKDRETGYHAEERVCLPCFGAYRGPRN